MCLSSNAATFMRCMWLISKGMSSIRSVSMLKASFMPSAYQNLTIASRFKRTVSIHTDQEVNTIVQHLVEHEIMTWMLFPLMLFSRKGHDIHDTDHRQQYRLFLRFFTPPPDDQTTSLAPADHMQPDPRGASAAGAVLSGHCQRLTLLTIPLQANS